MFHNITVFTLILMKCSLGEHNLENTWGITCKVFTQQNARLHTGRHRTPIGALELSLTLGAWGCFYPHILCAEKGSRTGQSVILGTPAIAASPSAEWLTGSSWSFVLTKSWLPEWADTITIQTAMKVHASCSNLNTFHWSSRWVS